MEGDERGNMAGRESGRDIRPVHSLFSWASGRRGRPVLPQAGVSSASARLLVLQTSCSAIAFRVYRCSPGACTELQRACPPLPSLTSPPRPLEIHSEAFRCSPATCWPCWTPAAASRRHNPGARRPRPRRQAAAVIRGRGYHSHRWARHGGQRLEWLAPAAATTTPASPRERLPAAQCRFPGYIGGAERATRAADSPLSPHGDACPFAPPPHGGSAGPPPRRSARSGRACATPT